VDAKTHKTPLSSFYALNLTKIWFGNFLGNFSWSLGDFFTKTSGHPGCFPEKNCCLLAAVLFG
jgi:hypothetical protein